MMNKIVKTATMLSLILAGFLGLAGIASAVTYNLRTEQISLSMPDGTVVTMWGFAQCTTGFTSCNTATVPGPQITVPVGDSTLVINLRNYLPEEVSVVIPGLTQSGGMTPVKFTETGIQGRQRTMSFTNSAASSDGITPTAASYTWTVRPGTYIYQSGSHPQVQVQMGLYGALKRDSASGQAYGVSSAYNTETLLLFSEIDPALHAAVAGGTYGPGGTMTSTIDYKPKYFLINGSPYSAEKQPLSLGTAGQTALLRFMNAGFRELVPVINGVYLSLVAEDGNPYAYPKSQYSLILAPGKTVDALVTNPGAGYYPLFERRLGLTNAASTGGGMMLSLEVTGPQSLLTVTKSGFGSGTVQSASMPGGISCGPVCASDSASYNTGTDLRLVASGDADSGFVRWTGDCTGTGDCIVTMSSARNVTAVFNRKDHIGIYRTANVDGRWYLDNNTGLFDGCGAYPGLDICSTDSSVSYGGTAGDIGVSGDWNGNGTTDIGIYRNGTWYLDTGAYNIGTAIVIAGFGGVAGDIPVTGDWNGDGITDIGIYRNGTWYLDTGAYNIGTATVITGFGGVAGDIPVTGDWNGDDTTDIGIYRSGAWHLDDGTHAFPVLPTYASFGGVAGDIPVSGDWDGNGKTQLGILRTASGRSTWHIDSNINGLFDTCGTTASRDVCFMPFGGWSTDRPVTGHW